jgi:chromate transporter
VPSCTLTFVVARVLTRWSKHPWLALVKAGLVPVALGLILASGIDMIRVADPNALALAISVETAAFVLRTMNPFWALATGTCVNVVARQLGWA